MSGLSGTGLTAAYGDRLVLDGVDLAVAPAEWLGIIGPNGSGKSTLLRVAAGALPTTGVVRVDGVDIATLRRREVAAAVAVVPQMPVLPEGMPVRNYVLLGRTPHISYWGTESARDLDVVDEVMTRLDLEGFGDRTLDELSGGERQRAVLARALAQEPSILLLDEPTTALDLGHQQQVLELVDRLRRERGMAVVSALHDLTLAAQYADRLLLLYGGRVIAAGEPEEVLTVPNLTRHYGAGVAILRTSSGEIVVAPDRRGQVTTVSNSRPIP